MIKRSDLWTGQLNLSIERVRNSCPEILLKFQYVLITMIDSDDDIPSMWSRSPDLARLNLDVTFLGQGAVTSAEKFFSKLATHSISNGFDEFWLYLEPPTIPKPEGTRLDCDPDLQENLNVILSWFKESRCQLGIADGIELNYIAQNKADAIAIERVYSKGT